MQEKIKVSICIVVQDNYWQSRYCIENLMAKIDVKAEILILDNGSKDKRIVDFCAGISSVHIIEPEPIQLAEAYNKLFRNVKGDFVCIFPIIFLVSSSWLSDLIFYNELVGRSGISAIAPSFSNCQISPLLSKSEELVNVWIRDNNLVEGVWLFNSRLLAAVGAMDEQLGIPGYELKQYAFRVQSIGCFNHYIPKQYLSRIDIVKDINSESEIKFNEHIAELRKKRIFSIELFQPAAK